jgi:hypothetical protein
MELYPELLPDESAKTFLDFGVPGYGSTSPRSRVCVKVVPFTRTLEETAGFYQFADELTTLHAGIAIGLDRARLRTLGCSCNISR